MFNNWLVNLTGKLGQWIEGDLMQEHYNRWLEDMVQKKGGQFDNKFYRSTLAPNVHHFLRIKEEIESAFDLKARSKAHTSPHLRDEFQQLLRMHREDELHLFCSKRSMGHAAVNRFDRGYKRLEEGRLDDFLKKSTAYADILDDIQKSKEAVMEQRLLPVPLPVPESVIENLNGVNATEVPMETSKDAGSDASEDHDGQSTDTSSNHDSDDRLDCGGDEDSEHDEESDIDRSEEHLVSGRDRPIYGQFNSDDVDSGSDSDIGDGSDDEGEVDDGSDMSDGLDATQ
jgi:hypothetical protein